MQPIFGDIAWTCAECLRPHVFELLAEAEDVVMEKHLSSALRPDITIMGPGRRPTALLEVRKTYLSKEAKRFAHAEGIPLFVVDVLDGVSEQATLHNRQRRWYDDIPELDEESRQLAQAAEGFSATVFDPWYDSKGDLVDAFLRYNDEEPDEALSWLGIPSPRRGHLLFAHESTLGCESQRLDPTYWLKQSLGRKAS